MVLKLVPPLESEHLRSCPEPHLVCFTLLTCPTFQLCIASPATPLILCCHQHTGDPDGKQTSSSSSVNGLLLSLWEATNSAADSSSVTHIATHRHTHTHTHKLTNIDPKHTHLAPRPLTPPVYILTPAGHTHTTYTSA